VKKGSASRTEYVWLLDSSAAGGVGKTGLTFSGPTAYYARNRGAATAITLATQTATGAWSSGGFVEVDSANMPGLYRFDPPDAAFASGVNKVIFLIKGSGFAPVILEFQLVDFDPENAASLGLTNLDATVSSRATQASVDDLPTNAEFVAGLAAADDAVLARLGTPAGASVSADIAAIKSDTTAIVADGSGLDAAGVRAAIGMASPNLDTQLAVISSQIGAVGSSSTAIKAKTDQLTFTVPGVVDANVTHVIADAVRQDGSNDTNWGGQP